MLLGLNWHMSTASSKAEMGGAEVRHLRFAHHLDSGTIACTAPHAVVLTPNEGTLLPGVVFILCICICCAHTDACC